MLESWARDVAYTFRRLRKHPTYAVLTVLTLALGVAGTAAVFGIARRLLLEPLPVRNEKEVAVFWSPGDWSEAEFLYLRPNLDAFRGVAAFRQADATLEQPDAPARLVHGVSASAELFRVLGVSPAAGPGFRPGDDLRGAEPTVVLSHSLWRELGGDRSIVGRRIQLAGVPRTVVGVMPEGFWFPDPTAQAWIAEELDPDDQSGNYALVGRLPPGTAPAAMTGALQRITRALGDRFHYPPEWDKTKDARLTPLREHLVGPVKTSLLAMLAAMAVILLIACVNVAALMLGEVDSRATELAVRAALGAQSGQLLKQLVVEVLVIGGLAGVAGAAMALVGFRFLVAALPLGVLAGNATVDWTLFAAAMAIALLAAAAVALVPGATVARGDLQRRLTRIRTAGIGGRGGRLEGGLVVGQVALVLLMCGGAALLIRSVAKLRAIDPGVETGDVAVVDVLLPATSDVARRPQLLGAMVRAVEALPGVRSAAAVEQLPLRGAGDVWGIGIQNRPDVQQATAAIRIITPGYFATMGIPVRRGRGLQDGDRTAQGEEGTVVINQALADQYFHGADPLGQHIAFMRSRWDRVVGVVGNVAEAELSTTPVPARYYVYEQVPRLPEANTIVIRTRPGGDPAAILPAARRAIQSAAPDAAVREMTT
ncbi:MAG TPA: ABC transporter permease, partial [Longimicrobiaceae bacterium]